MFRFSIKTLFILTTLACIFAAFIAFSMRVFDPMMPARYAGYLDVNPVTYSSIENLTALEFSDRIYSYDENQFVDAIKGCNVPPQLANEYGHVPALKFDGDTYIILRKWINESGGLAISSDPDFVKKLEQFEDDFVVRHVRGNIYHWDLDLERDSFR